MFWAATGKWYAEGPGSSGGPFPSRCRRYRSLGMLKGYGPPVSHDTPSCKQYEPTHTPQPLKRPERIEADWLA
jgi:hypothetical protein